MNDRQIRYLKMLEQSARTMRDFTETKLEQATCAPHVVESYLRKLIAVGYVRRTGEVYAITSAGIYFLAAQRSVPAGRICNAAMEGAYRPPVWPSLSSSSRGLR